MRCDGQREPVGEHLLVAVEFRLGRFVATNQPGWFAIGAEEADETGRVIRQILPLNAMRVGNQGGEEAAEVAVSGFVFN